MIITAFRQKVYNMVKLIPKGRVSTYGQIALLIGSPNASRAVGNALHVNPDPANTPCFRVVNSEGFLTGAFAFGGKDEQRKMLEKDGIRVTNDQVDLEKYLWIPQVIRSKTISCVHGFSTKLGGVSEGIFDSLNLGMDNGDDPENIRANWEIFSRACGIYGGMYVYGRQVHDNKVLTVTEEDLRPPCEPIPQKFFVDGYVTDRRNVPLVIFTGDCAPVLLQDKKAKVIGAVHCGWKSTAADIERNVVEAMEKCGARAENICASIGPAIEKECFETGEDVVAAMEKLIGTEAADGFVSNKEQPGKYLVDLKGIIKERLVRLGLQEKNIEVIRACTMCEPGRFWSHRFTKGKRGMHANIIMMR